jgi:hypothetical protein
MVDLHGLIGRLIGANVDFVIIGGLAAEMFGASLSTWDLDVCCDFSVENLMRVQTAIGDLHPVYRLNPRRPAVTITPEFCQGLKNLYLDTDYGQLDILSDVLGLGDFGEVKRNSIEITFSGGTCRILSLDALIRSKEVLKEPRDREAVRELKAMRDRLKKG